MGLYRRRWKDRQGETHRTDVWWMAYTAGGKQHCESTGTTNKRLAKKILAIRLAEIAEGRFSGLLKSHPPKLKEYLSKYLDSRMDLHPNTRTRYAVSSRALEGFFGGMRLPDITDARVEEYTAARRKGGTGAAGVNRDLSLLRQVLQQAKRERYVAQNPLGDREHFLDERKERLQAKPFTVEEEQRLLAVATGYLRPLLMLLLDTGLRPNAEALPLKWSEVDFERGMIAVVASKTRAGLRTLSMTARLKTELLRWKALTGPQNSEFVFFHPRNPAKHLLQVPKTWKRTLKEANVEKRRLYDCRSTFCTRLYAAGIPPMLIELLMGHAGNGLVHAYAKADDDFKKEAAAKLEAFITSKDPKINILNTSTAWVN